MGKYVPISVPSDIKRVLEKIKGKHEWREFLPSLHSEATGFTSKRAFEELTSLLTTEDLKCIEVQQRIQRGTFVRMNLLDEV